MPDVTDEYLETFDSIRDNCGNTHEMYQAQLDATAGSIFSIDEFHAVLSVLIAISEHAGDRYQCGTDVLRSGDARIVRGELSDDEYARPFWPISETCCCIIYRPEIDCIVVNAAASLTRRVTRA